VPSIIAADRRYFSPSSPQVTSGCPGRSSTGGRFLTFLGQVKELNFFSHAAPGSSCHFRGCPTGAPFVVVVGVAAADAPAAALASALAAAEGFTDPDAPADALPVAFADGAADGAADGESAATRPEDSARPFGDAVAVGDGVAPFGAALPLALGDALPLALGDALPLALGDALPLGDALGDGAGAG
jgi:hypothetical protein